MTDFSNLVPADAAGDKIEAEFVFDMIKGRPSIFFAPAVDENSRFLDTRLRISIERAQTAVRRPRGKGKPAEMTPADLKKQIEDDRESDRKIFAEACALRWGTPPRDAEGNEPEFTRDSCYDFFRAVPNWMFDHCRNWVANIYNFVEDPNISEEEAATLGN